MIEEYTPDKEFGRENSRTLRQWLQEETCNKDAFHKLESQGLVSQTSLPRKSFSHLKKVSLVNDNSMPNSPVFPTYMAVTESAKAKARSISTPKNRTEFLELFPNQSEPHKEGIYLWSSRFGTPTSTNRNNDTLWQRCQSADHHHYH